MAVRSLFKRTFDLVVVVFFLSHIPITIFIDAQAVLPASWFPETARGLLAWYLDSYGDPLCKLAPPWFRALVWTELLLQLPFFFIGTYAFAVGDNRIRKPAIIYGFSVATTLVPILGELMLADGDFARVTLLAFYLPYFVVPLLIGIKMLISEEAFARQVPRSHKKRA